MHIKNIVHSNFHSIPTQGILDFLDDVSQDLVKKISDGWMVIVCVLVRPRKNERRVHLGSKIFQLLCFLPFNLLYNTMSSTTSLGCHGFIFDMDGTLIDSEQISLFNWRATLASVVNISIETASEILDEELYNAHIGVPGNGLADKLVLRIASRGLVRREMSFKNVPISADELMSLKQTKMADFVTQAPPPVVFDGVSKAIEKLQSGSVSTVLCTGSYRIVASALLDAAPKIGKLFPPHLRITNCDCNESKPHPEPYQRAAAKIGFHPSQCIAFEDSPSGCGSASAAGIGIICGVLTSFTEKKLIASGATICFNTTVEAIEWASNKVFLPIEPTLCVFDFDWSLVNENSDTWVFDQLRPSLRKYAKLIQKTDPDHFGKGCWTALMDHCIVKLLSEDDSDEIGKQIQTEQNVSSENYKARITKSDLSNALQSIPVFVKMIEAVQLASAAGADLLILSDANTWYISVILEFLGLEDLFASGGIISNVGEWQKTETPLASHANEILRIKPFHRDAHFCPKCPPNLCKGLALKQLLARRHRQKINYPDVNTIPLNNVSHRNELTLDKLSTERILYVGDGRGDVCPCNFLGTNDVFVFRINSKFFFFF